jgi:hypothetical protein
LRVPKVLRPWHPEADLAHIAEAVQNKTGKNTGKRSIWFNGRKKDKDSGITPAIKHHNPDVGALLAAPRLG